MGASKDASSFEKTNTDLDQSSSNNKEPASSLQLDKTLIQRHHCVLDCKDSKQVMGPSDAQKKTGFIHCFGALTISGPASSLSNEPSAPSSGRTAAPKAADTAVEWLAPAADFGVACQSVISWWYNAINHPPYVGEPLAAAPMAYLYHCLCCSQKVPPWSSTPFVDHCIHHHPQYCHHDHNCVYEL